MKQTRRQIVLDTLNLKSPARVPHQIWDVPWTYQTYPAQMKAIRQRFVDDIVWCPRFLKTAAPTKGDPYEIGQYVDEWGCVFENRHRGVIGEVKQALIEDEEWEDGDKIRVPKELLALDVDAINDYCKNTDQFVLAGSSVRLFERMQFLAGTEKLLMDLLIQPEGMLEVLDKVHAFFCEELEAWAKTDVDGLFIQDDWGTQISLLISPKLWVELFKPRYADYAAIARKYGKKRVSMKTWIFSFNGWVWRVFLFVFPFPFPMRLVWPRFATLVGRAFHVFGQLQYINTRKAGQIFAAI